jgi:hypothetical protein
MRSQFIGAVRFSLVRVPKQEFLCPRRSLSADPKPSIQPIGIIF